MNRCMLLMLRVGRSLLLWCRWGRVNTCPFPGATKGGWLAPLESGPGVFLCMPALSGAPDMLAYLYLLAAAQQEFNLPACLAYDVAFRRKAGRFHLSTWGQLDPKAFTGVGKATPSTTSSSCALCLEATHSTMECS